MQMNLAQYKAQIDPEYMPNVVLGKNDCRVIFLGQTSDKQLHYEVAIEWENTVLAYRLKPKKSNTLYTINFDGSIKAMSCFHLDTIQFPEVFK